MGRVNPNPLILFFFSLFLILFFRKIDRRGDGHGGHGSRPATWPSARRYSRPARGRPRSAAALAVGGVARARRDLPHGGAAPAAGSAAGSSAAGVRLPAAARPARGVGGVASRPGRGPRGSRLSGSAVTPLQGAEFRTKVGLEAPTRRHSVPYAFGTSVARSVRTLIFRMAARYYCVVLRVFVREQEDTNSEHQLNRFPTFLPLAR